MDKIPYLLFISIFFVDYLSVNLGYIPRKLTWLPEVWSLLAGIILVVKAKYVKIKIRYILLFAFFVLHVAAGAIANDLQAGPMIAGIRTYFRYIPFFILPFVIDSRKTELRRYVRFILLLSIIQCPIVVVQRFIQFKGIITGDVISGTLGSSGLLSVYLLCCITLCLSFYLRKEITKVTFGILLLLLFLPTTINETKATFFLLPVIMFAPVFLNFEDKFRKQKLVAVCLITVFLISSFVIIYNFLMQPGHGRGIIEFLRSRDDAVSYLYKDSSEEFEKEIEKRDNVLMFPHEFRETTKKIKRVDSILLACRVLYKDPAKLFLGIGIGNSSVSFIDSWSGEYSDFVELRSGMTALTRLLWEVGFIGCVCFGVFFCFLFYDSRQVSFYKGFIGAMGLGWMSVVLVLFISLMYSNYLVHNVIGYTFFFISGYIVRASNRLEMEIDM